jgi:hypothetical protein
MDIWYRLKSSVKNQIPTSSTKGWDQFVFWKT